MVHIQRDNMSYQFVRNYKHDQDIRWSFNKLTESVFGFNFEKWYQNGFWADNYIPYSLMHNNQVISNVSINIIEFEIKNEIKKGLQIGTVMTDEKYRNKGLNKFLLEEIINEWKDQSDFIYLFANDSVLEFYPKFNFKMIDEFQYSKPLDVHNSRSSIKKLNIDDMNDRAFLLNSINESIPISKVSMRNNASLIMFYCLYFKKNSIFHIEELEAIVIADFEGETIYLNDIFSAGTHDLDDIIQFVSNEHTKKVVLGFTPFTDMDYEMDLLKDGDTLFMLENMDPGFNGNQLMFPLLSHA